MKDLRQKIVKKHQSNNKKIGDPHSVITLKSQILKHKLQIKMSKKIITKLLEKMSNLKIKLKRETSRNVRERIINQIKRLKKKLEKRRTRIVVMEKKDYQESKAPEECNEANRHA